MYMKPTENSNIVSNNPEAVNLSIAELVLKQWGWIRFSARSEGGTTPAPASADLGYPHRVYCSSHSIEYIKKYGLRDLSNLNTESNPARSASVLTGHLNTFGVNAGELRRRAEGLPISTSSMRRTWSV